MNKPYIVSDCCGAPPTSNGDVDSVEMERCPHCKERCTYHAYCQECEQAITGEVIFERDEQFCSQKCVTLRAQWIDGNLSGRRATKGKVLKMIEQNESELADEDATGHVYWNMFKEKVNGIKL